MPQVRNFRRGWTQVHANSAVVDRLSGVIGGGAFRVMDGLGAGFAEKVHEKASDHEMDKAGLAVLQQ